MVPIAILLSWPGYVAKLISHSPGDNTALEVVRGLTIPMFFFYYGGLLVLVSILSRMKRASAKIIPIIVHLSGGLACMFKWPRIHTLPPGILNSESYSLWPTIWYTFWYAASYVVAVALVLFWLKLDWRSAQKGRQV